MHEDYEDDDFEDSQDNLENKYKHYFKFDPAAWDIWGKWLQDALDDLEGYSFKMSIIPGFPFKSIPVNDYFSNAGKGKSFQYLGINHHKEPVYKTKYFVHNKLDSVYKNHIRANAVHFLNQPNYYDGMFDILN